MKPYNLQGFAVYAPVVGILENAANDVIVSFVNTLVKSGKEDLDTLDRNGKIFFEGKGKKGMKKLVSKMIIGTVPPKLRMLFANPLGNSCAYTTLVIQGIESMY